ncbi:MAG: HAD-IIIC family phosphatase [Mycobacteriales bacterium]
MSTPLAELLDLYRTGRLAAGYPRVRQLLADLDGDGLAQAGRLLARLDPDEVAGRHPDVPAVRVALTGHGTLAGLLPPLAAELARHGLLLRAEVGEYGGYARELSDPDSLVYAGDCDLVLCVLDPRMVTDELPLPWRPADAGRVLAAKVELVERLAGRYEGTGAGTLVLNTLPLPRAVTGQLVDHRSRAALGAAWREANARLLRLPEDHPATVVVDLDPLLAEGGVPAVEPRLDTYAGCHLSLELLARYAREVGHLARHLTGRTRKCLALDLDETVWGGTLGDDGVEGLEVAGGDRGEAFRAFQRVARQLGAQGVLLAAVSKNDPEPVRQALREHPEMTLREEDFVRVAAGWGPKHESLAELVAALNLGADSVVFVDDSPAERGLVRRELPDVAVVEVDGEPALHVDRLLADGWFDTRELTEEDRARVARYREELDRTDFLQHFESLDEYRRELDIRVRLARAGEPDVPRLSQLTLRTNQFNLTTRRLSPADVSALLDDPDALVLTIRASDRFGDNGMVGAIFARRGGDGMTVENFLLSCRVFVRGIERACLAALLRHARDAGAAAVYGAYRPTAKNRAMREFYPRHGFTKVGDDGGTALFRHDLTDIVAPPDCVRLTDELEREPT